MSRREPPLKLGPLQVEFEDEVLTVAVSGTLLLAGWRDAPILQHMLEIDRVDRGLLSRPPRHALVNLLYSGTPRFSPEVRAEVERQTREGDPSCPVAHVILVGGMIGAAARAFLNTTLLVARAKSPTRFFTREAVAAEWLHEQMGAEWPSERLEQCLLEMRELASTPPSSRNRE